MTSSDRLLTGLAESIVPDDVLSSRVRSKLMVRLQPGALNSLVAATVPDPSFAAGVKSRILERIRPSFGCELSSLALGISAPVPSSGGRGMILARLRKSPSPLVHVSLKWAAAFAFVLLAFRALPLVLLASQTQAGLGVQMIPSGPDVAVYVGGIWRPVTQPEVLHGSVMVRTGDASRVTVILSDQGVIRFGDRTTMRFNDLSDRVIPASVGPAALLVRGRIWALGLVPPVVDGLKIETSRGSLSLNTGSVSIEQDDTRVVAEVYDHGATFEQTRQTAFLVAGEKVTVRGTPFSIGVIPARSLVDDWVTNNLAQDAAHRTEIAKLQEARREQVAGILPTSAFLYPAKRFAEEVDYFFTLTQDGRTEKRIQQANTRLNEALTLVDSGQGQAASGSVIAYRDALVVLAGEKDDNIVKSLIRQQIAEASASLTVNANDPAANAALLRDAVEQVGAVIPDSRVSVRNVEGYVLVDKLAAVKQALAVQRDPRSAAALYAEVRPYLKTLLDPADGVHPLLRKEASALLVASSTLLKNIAPEGNDIAINALQKDMGQYLPAEPEQALLSETEIDRQIQGMMERIFIFRSPRSRYNQLLLEMKTLEGGPRRGMILRRLKQALPEGLGGYVQTEIKELGDELRSESR